MSNLIYISPLDIKGINAVQELGNEQSFLNYLDYVDFHFVFFSALYQSGINSFETELKFLPQELINNPFWRERFHQINDKVYSESLAKSSTILRGNFDIEKDKKFNAPQLEYILNHFSSLFYSFESKIPFVCTQFVQAKDFNFLETRLSNELYSSIINLYSLISSTDVQTIVPQYSVLKKDVKRFEDIATSSAFRQYSESLELLPIEGYSKSLNNDIKNRALRIYNKHTSSLDMKSMTFSFIKSNKKILDLFTNKITSVIGDFVIESFEKVISENRMVHFYDFKEAFILRLFAERINELQKVGGKEAFEKVLNEMKKQPITKAKFHGR